MQYLFQQIGQALQDMHSDSEETAQLIEEHDVEEDEGFADITDDPTVLDPDVVQAPASDSWSFHCYIWSWPPASPTWQSPHLLWLLVYDIQYWHLHHSFQQIHFGSWPILSHSRHIHPSSRHIWNGLEFSHSTLEFILSG